VQSSGGQILFRRSIQWGAKKAEEPHRVKNKKRIYGIENSGESRGGAFPGRPPKGKRLCQKGKEKTKPHDLKKHSNKDSRRGGPRSFQRSSCRPHQTDIVNPRGERADEKFQKRSHQKKTNGKRKGENTIGEKNLNCHRQRVCKKKNWLGGQSSKGRTEKENHFLEPSNCHTCASESQGENCPSPESILGGRIGTERVEGGFNRDTMERGTNEGPRRDFLSQDV